LSLQAWGQSFDVYAKPTLKALVSDFHEMLTLFPAYPQGLSSLAGEAQVLTGLQSQFEEACPRMVNLKCQNSLKELKSKLENLKAKSLVMNRSLTFASSAYLNSLSGHRLFRDFEQDLEKISALTEAASFSIGIEKSSGTKTTEILTLLHRLKTTSDLMVIEFTPVPYRNEFRQFYFHFILPISKQFEHEYGDVFMKRSNEELNFHFHHFVMNLTKKNKKTPEGMSPYLNTMTNRWNVVTKIYQ